MSEELMTEETTEETIETTEAAAEPTSEASSETSVETAAEDANEATTAEAPSEPITAEASSEQITDEASSEPTTDENLITDADEIERALEAMIFASPKALTLKRIKSLLRSFNYDTENVKSYLESLGQKYENCGFQLIKIAGTYQFRSNPSQSDILQKLLEDKPVRISKSALEVLSIIAYKQPVSRAEIDAVRGVDSGHLTRGLLEKNLIKVAGHADTPGRPLLYGTTPGFLEVFTLDSLDDLPSLEEFNRELADTSPESDSDSDSSDDDLDVAALEAEAEFHDGISPLAANPDRGVFDEPSEDEVSSPDFGIEERAREEVEAPSN